MTRLGQIEVDVSSTCRQAIAGLSPCGRIAVSQGAAFLLANLVSQHFRLLHPSATVNTFTPTSAIGSDRLIGTLPSHTYARSCGPPAGTLEQMPL